MSSAGNRLKKLADKRPDLGFNPDCDARPASARVSSVGALAFFKEVKDAFSLPQQPEKHLQFNTQRLNFNRIDPNASSSQAVSRGNVLRCSLTERRQSRPPPPPVGYDVRSSRCLVPFRWRWPRMRAQSP